MDLREPLASRAYTAGLRKKYCALEKELHRKEKALAETAALLIFSEEAQAILGIDEDA